MRRNAGFPGTAVKKISYAGEPMDSETAAWIEKTFGVVPASMYGTTEVGVVLVNYPALAGYCIKPGSLGKPVPGARVSVLDPHSQSLEPGNSCEHSLPRY